MNKNIVVTYEPEGDENSVYDEIFDGLASVRFLPVESTHNRSRLLRTYAKINSHISLD